MSNEKSDFIKRVDDELNKQGFDESRVCEMVDEQKMDYLDDGWEEDFEDEHEAYLETGRGEAESDVIIDIKTEVLHSLEVTEEEFEQKAGMTFTEYLKSKFDVL